MRLALGIIVGAIIAFIVYIVGTAITTFHREGLVWGLIALLVWLLVAWAIWSERGPLTRRRVVP